MTRIQFWALMLVVGMILWTVVTLGFRAMLADPACAGVACDRMRAQTANWRVTLLVACVAGDLFGVTVLAWVTLRLRRS